MLDSLLRANAEHGGDAIGTAGGPVAWTELAAQAAAWAEQHRALCGKRVGLCLHNTPASFAVLAALDRLHCDAVLLPGELPTAEWRRRAEELELAAVVPPAADAEPPVPAEFPAAQSAGDGGSGSVIIL